jgi:hypothetical protein
MITEDQRLRVCKALARAARQEHLIGASRPEREFFEQVANPTCSTTEWLLLQCAHAVWSGARSAGPTVGLMLLVFSERELDLVGRLLQAFAADRNGRPAPGSALEAWLTSAGFPRLGVVP